MHPVRPGIYYTQTGQRYAVVSLALVPGENTVMVIFLPVLETDLPVTEQDFQQLLLTPPIPLWTLPEAVFRDMVPWPDGSLRPQFVLQGCPRHSSVHWFYTTLAGILGLLVLGLLVAVLGQFLPHTWTSPLRRLFLRS